MVNEKEIKNNVKNFVFLPKGYANYYKTSTNTIESTNLARVRFIQILSSLLAFFAFAAIIVLAIGFPDILSSVKPLFSVLLSIFTVALSFSMFFSLLPPTSKFKQAIDNNFDDVIGYNYQLALVGGLAKINSDKKLSSMLPCSPELVKDFIEQNSLFMKFVNGKESKFIIVNKIDETTFAFYEVTKDGPVILQSDFSKNFDKIIEKNGLKLEILPEINTTVKKAEAEEEYRLEEKGEGQSDNRLIDFEDQNTSLPSDSTYFYKADPLIKTEFDKKKEEVQKHQASDTSVRRY